MTPTQRKAAEQALEAYSLRDYDMGKYMEALRAALAEPQEPVLKQALTDPENQPNQFGVEFLMRGPKFAFKVGVQQFTLDYEPEEPGEFEFMRDALIHAFSTFTSGVKAEQPAEQEPFKPDWDRVEALRESLREHMADVRQLRAALAWIASHKNSDWSERCQQIVDKARAALAEQPAEQEPPIAIVVDAYDTPGLQWLCQAPPSRGTRLFLQPPSSMRIKKIHPLDVPLEVFLADLTTRPANVIRLEMRGLFDGEPLTVRHLCMIGRAEMKRWPNFGKKCLNEVEELLRARGLQLWENHDERSLRLLREHKEYFK